MRLFSFLLATALWLAWVALPTALQAQCAALRWLQFSPTPSPPLENRSGHAMAYDRARYLTVLYAGGELLPYPITRTGLFADTWEYDGLAWTQRFPSTTPPPLVGHAMSYV